MFKKIKEYYERKRALREEEAVKWEECRQSEKRILGFARGGFYQSDEYYNPNEYSLFYNYDYEDFDELIPIVLDIINELLKDYYVITHINDDIHKANLEVDMQKYPKIYKCTSKEPFREDYAKNYTIFSKAHDLYHDNYFYDNDASFITVTKGANIHALKAFYNTLCGYTYLGNYTYGFSVDPLKLTCGSYSGIKEFLLKNQYDMLFNYTNQHVVLSIQINPKTVNENKIVEIARTVCEKHGKKLNICL